MAFLQQLLKALASGYAAKNKEILAPTGAPPAPGSHLDNSGRYVSGADRAIEPSEPHTVLPGDRINNSYPQQITYDRPFQEAVAHLSPEGTWDAFYALPPSEQVRVLVEELEGLADGEKTRVMGLLQGMVNIKWVPLPGPQTDALFSEADIIFYGGAAGGGKSALLCGAAIRDHNRIRLFRRESVQVRNLVDEVQKILGTAEGYNGQDKIMRFKNTTGQAMIEFAHCQHEDDKKKYQGRPADLLGFDEITHFTESMFRHLSGWNRTDRKGQRTRTICTGNPPEQQEGRWVIKYWAPWLDKSHPSPAKAGELRWFTTVAGEDQEVDGPGPHGKDERGRDIYAKSRTFIPASLTDNPYLTDTGYEAALQGMPEPLRSMLLLGRFDLAVRDEPWQIIPTAWVEAAMKRWTPNKPLGAKMTTIGVDVAQGGAAETVISPRYGNWFAEQKCFKGVDTTDGAAVSGLVFSIMRDGCAVAVDVGGGWGADAHAHMATQGVNSIPVNWVKTSNHKTADGTMKFVNERAEKWWRLREALNPNAEVPLAIPPDPTLKADLCTPLWFRTTSSGEIQVESKKDIIKRLGRSTDRGDALVMSNGYGEEARVHDLPTHSNVAYLEHKRRSMTGGRPNSYRKAQPRW